MRASCRQTRSIEAVAAVQSWLRAHRTLHTLAHASVMQMLVVERVPAANAMTPQMRHIDATTTSVCVLLTRGSIKQLDSPQVGADNAADKATLQASRSRRLGGSSPEFDARRRRLMRQLRNENFGQTPS